MSRDLGPLGRLHIVQKQEYHVDFCKKVIIAVKADSVSQGQYLRFHWRGSWMQVAAKSYGEQSLFRFGRNVALAM